MNRISILDPALADKIAAGEVVERPSSVVKELVENSIDAKATQIQIRIIDGGRTLIEVKDNGIGMSKEDAILSIRRHATSKIKTDYDLFSIQTMGFRGEALSAISSVSKFTLMTCEENQVGTKLVCLNSEVVRIEPCALTRGTIIQVEELFYNTPARLKYLKADSSEFSAILDITNKLALAHPEISFSLYSNQKLMFQTSGKDDIIEILSEIFGLQVAKNMHYFEKQTHDFKIYGYTSSISFSKSNRYSIFTYVNGRYIKNKGLTDSVIEGYHELLFENRYPFTVLYIETDPTILDVNIHPTKQDIRISKEFDLRKLIKETIHETLTQTKKINEIRMSSTRQEQQPIQPFFDFSIQEKEETYPSSFTQMENSNETEFVIPQSLPHQEDHYYLPIGQIHGTYIVAQSQDGFIIIDQHAAAERIRYERYQKLFLENHHSIDLLFPLVIELSNSDYQELLPHLSLLKEVKIDAELFGNNAIKITHVPYYLDKIDLKTYVETLIQQIIQNKKIDLNALKDYAIATLACKASLKANAHLSFADMEKIIHDLFACQNPYTCPHGRPTLLKYTLQELQKAFKRT